MEFAFGQGRSLSDVDVLFEMTIRWADQTHSLVDLVTAAAEEMVHRLGPGVPARMGGSPLRSRYEHIIRRLATEAGIDGMVQTAAKWSWKALVGTNQAFGGSGSAEWERVREEWGGRGPRWCRCRGRQGDAGEVEAAPGEDSSAKSPSPASEDAYSALIAAIAQALIGEDKDARQPAVPAVPLSVVLPRRGRGAGGDGGDGSSSGGRRVTAQAARGGSAIGAAVAYRDRDAEALASYGLRLEELDALSPRMRCARILDLAIGQAGHPDEQAMREASVAQVKALVSGAAGTASVSPLEAVRDFIGELTVRLGLIELRDQYLAQIMTAAESRTREKGLRQWVRAKVARLDLAGYGRCRPPSSTRSHAR